jgi:hypothetical protein
MVNPKQVVRAVVFASLLSLLSAASVTSAYGQDFSLAVSSLTPATAVVPGESATATIDLEPVGIFSNPVSLSCQVTSGPITGLPPAPQCGPPSPASQTPPADGPSLTIKTTGGTGANATPAGTYQLTVTGTSGAITHTVILYLSVSDLTEDYTLSVLPALAIPSPIPAGSSATTTVSVLPIGSYTGSVTLACLSITPIVTAAPYCTFNRATVSVTSNSGATSTLTINTFGPAPGTSKLWTPRLFYALWLAVPGLALVGAGARGNNRRKLLGMFLLVGVAGSLLLLPACNSSTVGTRALNGDITPNNTYVLTLTAVDANGAGPSNVILDQATVTIQVTTANTAH